VESSIPPQPPRLLDQLRERLRVKHYFLRTEISYVAWVERYLQFHRAPGGAWRHPKDLGSAEAERFLTHLAVEGRVAAATQNQALAALLFLYHEVLGVPLGDLDAVRARRPKRLPTVLSIEETRRLLVELEGEIRQVRLAISLLYGTGMRLMECVRLRIKDVDFDAVVDFQVPTHLEELAILVWQRRANEPRLKFLKLRIGRACGDTGKVGETLVAAGREQLPRPL